MTRSADFGGSGPARLLRLCALALRTPAHPPDGGLTRFKAAFAPLRESLYLGAQSRGALGIVASDIARAVFLPAPLASVLPPAQFALNEIAPAAAAWHMFADRLPVGRAAPLR